MPSRALVRFAQKRLRDSWLDRIAWWAGACLVLGWGAALCLVGGSEEIEAGVFAVRTLVASSWSAGLFAALGATRSFSERDAGEGVLRMMAARGVDSRRLASAYWIATVRRIATVVGLPALALWVLALVFTRSPSGMLRHALLGGAILVYALLFAAVLGSVVRWVTAWLPERPRTLLLGVIAVPYLMSLVSPVIPSLPQLSSGFAVALTRMAQGGP